MSFLDMSSSNHTFTTGGTIAPTINTSIKKFGAGSVDFTNGYLESNITSDFIFGNLAWSIDFWVYIKSGGSGSGTILSSQEQGADSSGISWGVYYATGGTPSFILNRKFSGGGTNGIAAEYDIPSHYDEWIHVAFSGDGTTDRAWVNGELKSSTLASPLWEGGANDILRIGSNYSESNPFNGYIDELRILKGSTVWNTDDNFTPQIEPYEPAEPSIDYNVLLLHAADFTDSSDNDFVAIENGTTINTSDKVFGTGSFEFNGSSNYLDYGDDDLFKIWDNATVDFWFKTSETYAPLVGYGNATGWASGNSNRGWSFIMWNGAVSYSTWGTGNAEYHTNNWSVSSNTWHHVCMCSDESNIYFYVDGVYKATVPFVDTYRDTSSPILRIGYLGGGINYFDYYDGLIDELRILNGICAINDPTDKLYILSGDPTDGFDVPDEPYA